MRKELVKKLSEKRKYPTFRAGDRVRVLVKIKEGEKERLQAFEGTVIRKRRGGKSASFTVRKVSYGIGVERIFPLESPSIERVEVVQPGKARRSRLYYLRKRRGREATVADSQREIMEEGGDAETSLEGAETPVTAEQAVEEPAATTSEETDLSAASTPAS